jgi:hypothetical protein
MVSNAHVRSRAEPEPAAGACHETGAERPELRAPNAQWHEPGRAIITRYQPPPQTGSQLILIAEMQLFAEACDSDTRRKDSAAVADNFCGRQPPP